MPRTSRVIPDPDKDSSSDGIEDISEEVIEHSSAFPPKKHAASAVPWVDKYTPGRSQDVSINPKKLKQVRETMREMLQPNSKCRMLLLSGPAGSSKSTVIKCLAKELKTANTGDNGIRSLSIIEYFDSLVDDVNQPDHFRDFMEGCRYRSGKNTSVILIEELPNVFHGETLQSFRNCIKNWIHSSPELNLPPVVICLTEVDLPSDTSNRGYFTVDNYLTVETLLGRDILYSGLSSGLIERIKFLPIAKTFMKKTLNNILASEKIRLPKTGPPADFMQSLYDSGDIRSSISNLEFWLSKGRGGHGFMREGQIGLFYALGKVIHSSSKSPSSEENHDPDSMYSTVDSVMEKYNNLGLLQLGLLENYQIYNGSQFGIDTAANIVDSLSVSDSLGRPGYEEYAFKCARYELSQVNLSARTLPMKFPRHFKFLKEQNKVRREVSSYGAYLAQGSVSFNDINLFDGFYVPTIRNSFRYRLKYGRKPNTYNRVGGRFKEIYADEDLPTLEDDDTATGEKDQFSVDILEKMKKEENSKDDSDDVMSEEIEDSGAENSDDTLDDTLNDELLTMSFQAPKRSFEETSASSKKKAPQQEGNYDEGFSDDPELDMLVSQGKL